MSHDASAPAPSETVDLTNCDREPIHILGRVQSYGCLIATASDWMISHVSQNVKDILGFEADHIIGTRLVDIIPEQTVHEMRGKLQLMSMGISVGRLFSVDILEDGRLFDISLHISGKSYVFEFEPKTEPDGRDEMAIVQPLVSRIQSKTSIMEVVKEGAQAMRILSGFDRVMVYRFLSDGSGEVVAENCERDMEPYLGLRYPASDIPKQARDLYKRSLLRLISDVDGKTSEIVPAASPDGTRLDLSLAATRSVSPIHLEYLRNMGVSASMSVSIMKDGELWGLFACHHRTPRYVDYERRTAIELFAQFFSYELSGKSVLEIREKEGHARELHDKLMIRLSGGNSIIDDFQEIADDLSSIIVNDGIIVFLDGQFVSTGTTPTREEFMTLVRFLNTADTSSIFATDNIGALHPPALDYVERCAGLLAVPISRSPRDYIVFFRREIARTVKWAGNPEKPVQLGPNGARLTPRKSFEAWRQIIRGSSKPWSDRSQRAAETLRISLIEIVLKLSEEANKQRRKSGEKQELLIAELNHRVRNILNLIQGLVSQSREGAKSVADYTKVLDGRIQSLARAHDQLTRESWQDIPLKDLINVELKAYLNSQSGRVNITGEDPSLVPEAFSVMALVIHELVTNSAKYGALTDQSGTVQIDLSTNAAGDLAVHWQELGGPPVKPPTRQGFGTTIIERSIPFELKGKVDVSYKVSGVEVWMHIPSRFVSLAAAPRDEDQESRTEAPVLTRKLDGEVLVLEDNMIIALDARDILIGQGADTVTLVSSVADALAAIQDNPPTFAMLDVNLGDQTSLPVALKLAELKIPMILATGYGDAETVLKGYPTTPVVSKPFTKESIMRALSEI